VSPKINHLSPATPEPHSSPSFTLSAIQLLLETPLNQSRLSTGMYVMAATNTSQNQQR